VSPGFTAAQLTLVGVFHASAQLDPLFNPVAVLSTYQLVTPKHVPVISGKRHNQRKIRVIESTVQKFIT
jgi:hypothetical protein